MLVREAFTMNELNKTCSDPIISKVNLYIYSSVCNYETRDHSITREDTSFLIASLNQTLTREENILCKLQSVKNVISSGFYLQSVQSIFNFWYFWMSLIISVMHVMRWNIKIFTYAHLSPLINDFVSQ